MHPSFSPYAPQGLMPQSFMGLPQLSPGLIGPQGAFGINVPLAYDYQAQSPYAFGAAMNPYLQNPFSANQYLPNPQLLQSPQFSYGTQPQGFAVHSPFLNSGSLSGYAGGHIPAQQLVPVLAQLAQQIAIQSPLIQQLGITLHQLAQQLTAQNLQPHLGSGLGAGQVFGAAVQGGYGGFTPQVQGWWGGNRPQTIQ
ncbi:MAG TPA: hypothetical protein VMU67_07670 [Steroidobacteraceae bacterium]|nr:hypothetical protein [Steroidobacteraceae bacterium]